MLSAAFVFAKTGAPMAPIGYQNCENVLVSYGSNHAKSGWLSV